MSNGCKHKSIKRKMILAGKREGTYRAYCSQQCKRIREIIIVRDDILEVLPNYKSGE